MKKGYYFICVLFTCVLLSNCTNDEDLDNKQISAEEERRKGKVAVTTLDPIETNAEEEQAEKGKLRQKL